MKSNTSGEESIVDPELTSALIEFVKELTGLVKDARKQLAEAASEKGGE